MIKRTIRRIIDTSLSIFDFELIRKEQNPSMAEGISWLSSHNIPVTTVLDVGASNGCWSKQCAKHFPDAEYVLFEPQPIHQKLLQKLTTEGTFKNRTVAKAVGSTVGTITFKADTPFGGALVFDSDIAGENIIEVPVTTIDNTVNEEYLQGPFLVKLDTHGFEKEILEGAKQTLTNCTALIIEAYNYRIEKECMLFSELCAYLSTKGFRPIKIADILNRPHDGSLWQMDLIFIRSDWDGFNYISYK